MKTVVFNCVYNMPYTTFLAACNMNTWRWLK